MIYIIACRQNQENTSAIVTEADRRKDMTPNGDSNSIDVNKMCPIHRIRKKTEIAAIVEAVDILIVPNIVKIERLQAATVCWPMATIKRFQAPIRISSKSNEIPLKSGYCIARSLPGEYRHKLEEDQHESKRGKPCIIVAASRKPNAQGLPDANPLPRHDKDELHEDNNSSQGGDNVQKEPSDGDLRNPATELDSNSNDQNRYLEVEPPVREDRSQKANPIYSDAAPDHQSHWQYSDIGYCFKVTGAMLGC